MNFKWIVVGRLSRGPFSKQKKLSPTSLLGSNFKGTIVFLKLIGCSKGFWFSFSFHQVFAGLFVVLWFFNILSYRFFGVFHLGLDVFSCCLANVGFSEMLSKDLFVSINKI